MLFLLPELRVLQTSGVTTSMPLQDPPTIAPLRTDPLLPPPLPSQGIKPAIALSPLVSMLEHESTMLE